MHQKSLMEKQFSYPLLEWFDLYGRKNLPWQHPKDAYRTWISEVMLQQTQVQTVIPYFNRFMERFPTVKHLAQASDDEVLSLWSGLGYYSRARNMHEAAKTIMSECHGKFPEHMDALISLPGIGPSTGAAIMSLAFDKPEAILDGNVKRVLARFFLIKGYPEQAIIKKIFWEKAHLCMPKERCADYTQAIMDLGATCCTTKQPNCINCPVQADCLAFQYQEQHSYPTKKPKKPVPQQQQQFLVLKNEMNLVYLEKRPPTGLWGGLWCLPGIEMDQCPIQFIKERFDLHGHSPKPLAIFKHKFSHFHLEISPIHIQTKPLNNKISEANGKWYATSELSSLGLAKPTQLILDQISD